MRRFLSIFMVLSMALCAASISSATDTKVGGSVDIDVKTGHVLTIAAGQNAKASTNVASLAKGAEVKGDFYVDVETGHILTLAAGLGAEADTNIGSIGF